VAPLTGFQLRLIWVWPLAVAVRPVGAAGGVHGVEQAGRLPQAMP